MLAKWLRQVLYARFLVHCNLPFVVLVSLETSRTSGMSNALHILYDKVSHFVGQLAQAVIRDRMPVGTNFPHIQTDRSPLRMGPLGKVQPGRDADHSPPFIVAVMEQEL